VLQSAFQKRTAEEESKAVKPIEPTTEHATGEMAEEKAIFLEHLKKAGFKRTAQRELILEVFLRTEGHSSAEDLYQLVKAEDPSVGFTTVYRTLKLLAECGLAREERLGDGRRRYEHQYKHPHHDHLICTECGELIEFYSEVIERKQDEIAAQYKFQPTRHSLRIFGVCANCQTKSNKLVAAGRS
jgi:Fur family transcriptional regulator, ferric uptake regulator